MSGYFWTAVYVEVCWRTFASIHDKLHRERRKYLCQDASEIEARDRSDVLRATEETRWRTRDTLIALNVTTVIVGLVDAAASCDHNLSLIDAIPFSVVSTSIRMLLLFEDAGALRFSSLHSKKLALTHNRQGGVYKKPGNFPFFFFFCGDRKMQTNGAVRGIHSPFGLLFAPDLSIYVTNYEFQRKEKNGLIEENSKILPRSSYAIDVICGVSDLFECEGGKLGSLWEMARVCGYNVTRINIEHLRTF